MSWIIGIGAICFGAGLMLISGGCELNAKRWASGHNSIVVGMFLLFVTLAIVLTIIYELLA